ncbi:MAG TPA: ELWxxDGT repeat protein [Verrucomicrobiae bacterium]|nr:ELWxxDGT repeat protein [Verrucomicrobiae bacterium]
MRRLAALAVTLSCLVLVPGLAAAAGGPARLLKDINTAPSWDRSSWPDKFTIVGKTVFFRAQTFAAGFELWKSDGTAAGTVLVKDIDPGPRSGLIPPGFSYEPREFAQLNGILLFGADDGIHGWEMWRSDGTAAGTFLLQDIRPGQESGLMTSYRSELVWVNKASGGLMYFIANDGVHGFELWRTDGTSAGTFLLQDIQPGTNSAFGLETFFTLDGGAAGGRFCFRATNDTSGGELWETDGTVAGTIMVSDILPGPGSGDPSNVTELNGQILFVGAGRQYDTELWKSDGTSFGTVLVKDLTPGFGSRIRQLTRAGNFAYFQVDSQLYRSDGTAPGTVLLHTFSDNGLALIGDLGGNLLLLANDGANRPKLWVSDGSPGGTFALKDIPPAGVYPGFQHFLRDGGIEYFLLDDGVHGADLWRTDGTPQGTRLVTEVTTGPGYTSLSGAIPWQGDLLFGLSGGLRRLNPDTGESTLVASVTPAALFPVGGRALFSYEDDVHGLELWVTDGTTEGTGLLKDIEALARTNPSDASHLGTPVGPDGKARAMYAASDGASYGLWVTDGTPRGTEKLEVRAGIYWGDPVGAMLGNIVYFAASDFEHGTELWRSDGTTGGTWKVTEIATEWGGVYTDPVAAGDRVYFLAEDMDHGAELWSSDGTGAGTHLVRDIIPGQDSGYPDNFTVVGDRLFFSAWDDHGKELWTSDGTEAGTHLVKDIVPGPSGNCCRRMLPFNGWLLFEANDNVHGYEIWVSDGTEEGTVMLADIVPGKGHSFTREVTVAGPLAFFSVDDGVHGLELWKTDGTPAGTVQVIDLILGRGDGYPSFLGAMGNSLLFLAPTLPQQHFEMWKSDGTEAGTVRLGADFAGDAYAAAWLGDGMLFTEVDDEHGLELWRTSGEAGGTAFVQDLAPGPNWSDPRHFVRLGTRVLFVADDPVADRELFVGRTSLLLGRADLAVRDLGEDLKGFGLPKGIETSLLAKLNPAVNAIASGRSIVAVIAIESFIRHVEAQVPRWIDAAEAADLKEFAGEVIDLLRAGVSPDPRPSRPGGPRPVPEKD